MKTGPSGKFCFLLTTLLPVLTVAVAAGDFVNFEVPPVHPLDLSPNGSLLAVCHTADNRVLLYSLASGTPVQTAAIPVGLVSAGGHPPNSGSRITLRTQSVWWMPPLVRCEILSRLRMNR